MYNVEDILQIFNIIVPSFTSKKHNENITDSTDK